MKNVTDETLTKHIKKEGLTVIDFWATWCEPCKAFMPTLDEMDKELEGKVQFLKVDVGECIQAVNKYRVRAVPTFVILKDGQMIDLITGVQRKEVFMNKLKSLMK